MRLFNLLKKELKYLFCNPIFLAVMTALNAISIATLTLFLKISQRDFLYENFEGDIVSVLLSIFSKATQLEATYAGFENIVALMIFAFALAIPAVSIVAFCRDKKQKRKRC